MGKGTRKRLDRQEQAHRQSQAAAAEQKKTNRKRLIWIAAAVVVVLAVAATVAIVRLHDTRTQNGDAIRDKVVMSSRHFKVDGAMMSYFIHSEMSAYVRANSNTISMEGLDPQADLKAQPCSIGSTRVETWFDYFADSATMNVRSILYLAEGASAAGLELTDADRTHIDEQIEIVRDQAKAENQTVEAFVAANFGQGVTTDDIRRAMELQMLGSKLRAHVESGVDCSEAALQTYYHEHAAPLSTCDYYTITFVSSIEDGFTEEQISRYNEGTKKWADDLAQCHDVDSFRAYLADYYRQYYEERGQSYDDAEIQASIDNNAALVEGHLYTGDALSIWALDPARQVGDTTVIEGENEYSVYLITKAPTRLDYKTRNFRQIVLTESGYETAVARRDKANELRDEFLAGEQTEAAFTALAEQYNEDRATRTTGGLCEDTRREDVSDNISAWLFEDGRKTGDIRIFKTDGDVYHLIYYVGEGEVCWKVTAKEQLKAEAYDQTFNELSLATDVTVDRDAIATLPG